LEPRLLGDKVCHDAAKHREILTILT
jgi:hypothetical protein